VSIAVNGLASSRKTPGVYLSVILGGAATSAGAAAKKILLVGNKITTTLTNTAPSFSVAAGTQANASPAFIASADDAVTYFGRGSELHRMAKRVFEQYPDALVYGCAVAESGGNRATVVCTFATNASAAYSIRCRIAGRTFDVPVASGDTPTVIATAVANAILDESDLPVTAQFALGVLTISAKHPGPRGNALYARLSFVDSAGRETLITSSSTSSGAGTTGTMSGGSAEGGLYLFTGGTTADDVTNALAAIASTKYDRIVSAVRDATNVDLIAAHVDSLAAVTSQKRQQWVIGSVDTLANATTLATGRNDSRGQIAWHYNSPVPAEEVAAQVAAARLIGDSFAGGSLVGEASDPAANLDGLLLKSIPTQHDVADRPTDTEIESALNNGLTVLAPSGAFTSVARSVTTRSLDALSNPSYSVLDTSNVTIIDHVADDLQSDLATVYAGCKLASDSADGEPPDAPRVVTPSMIRGRIHYKLKGYESASIIRDVDANLSNLQVEEDGNVAGRVNAEIPCEPIPGLHVLGGNVRQVV
jgi:phage tail sheath gpL-like